jgi:hypothetical protein
MNASNLAAGPCVSSLSQSTRDSTHFANQRSVKNSLSPHMLLEFLQQTQRVNQYHLHTNNYELFITVFVHHAAPPSLHLLTRSIRSLAGRQSEPPAHPNPLLTALHARGTRREARSWQTSCLERKAVGYSLRTVRKLFIQSTQSDFFCHIHPRKTSVKAPSERHEVTLRERFAQRRNINVTLHNGLFRMAPNRSIHCHKVHFYGF